MTEDLRLKFIINGEDKVSPTFTKVGETTASLLIKIDKSGKKVNETFGKTTTAVSKTSDKTTNLTDKLIKLRNEYDKTATSLSEISTKLDKFGNKCTLVGAGITATGYGMARAFKIDSTIQQVTDFEHELRALGNTGGLSTSELGRLGTQIRQIGVDTNNTNKDVLEGINTLVAAGMKPDLAVNYMTAIGKTATSQQANINDIANTTFSLADNMKVPLGQINYALNVLTAAGKEGRFELKSMAQSFPELTASASMLGMKGVKSVASLGAALQIAMKGAGTEGEAATNFSRFLGGLTSPLVVKNFTEKFGVSLSKIRNNAIKQGADPIYEILKVVKQKSNGNVELLSEVFRDKTMLDFIKPMLQNMDEYSRIKATILKSNGVIEEDYANMMGTTVEQWKKLTISLQKISFEKFEKPLKTVNSILTTINNHPMLQKGLFNAVIGTISFGAVLTGIGLVSKLGGKGIEAYQSILNYTQKLPQIYDVFDSVGLKASGIFIKRMMETNRKFGTSVGLGKSLIAIMEKESVFMWKKIGKNIINPLMSVPSAIKKTYLNVSNFLLTLPFNAPVMFSNSLTSIRRGFLNIPNAIKKALVAVRMFSVGVMLNPVGLAITGIAVGALLIVKYWKPITAFFKGTFRGIKDGLAPLQPIFTAVGNAIKPIVDWVKKLFAPINTDGKKAESWGYKFGQGIAWCITKVVDAVKWVKNLITLGGRIKFGNRGALTITGLDEKDGSHANGLTRVPFDGYRAELHKNEAVLTAKEADSWRNGKNNNGNKVTVNYSPVINLSGATETVKTEFLKELQKHKNEIAKIVEDVQKRKMRGAYA